MISVVVPLFNEQENLVSLHRRVTASLEAIGGPYELVLIDDGSQDQTPRMIDELAETDPRVVAVHLSRNFGHQAAISAGLDMARGEVVILMDGDLQDPPEILGDFIDAWREGYDVVYAIRAHRKESWWKRAGYFLFYRLQHRISDLEIPLDSGDFCLLDQKVVQAIRSLPEKQRFVRGLRAFVGFRQKGLVYARNAREAGQPKYTLRALIRLAIDGLVGFSGAPLRGIAYLGLVSTLVSFGLAGWVLGSAMWRQTTPPGWASTMVVVLFLGSVQILCLGIIGEYLRRIFIEVKGRPTYLVSDVKCFEEPRERHRPHNLKEKHENWRRDAGLKDAAWVFDADKNEADVLPSGGSHASLVSPSAHSPRRLRTGSRPGVEPGE